MVEKILSLAGFELGAARSIGHHYSTELPGLQVFEAN